MLLSENGTVETPDPGAVVTTEEAELVRSSLVRLQRQACIKATLSEEPGPKFLQK